MMRRQAIGATLLGNLGGCSRFSHKTCAFSFLLPLFRVRLGPIFCRAIEQKASGKDCNRFASLFEFFHARTTFAESSTKAEQKRKVGIKRVSVALYVGIDEKATLSLLLFQSLSFDSGYHRRPR